jgi:hypothetical protein
MAVQPNLEPNPRHACVHLDKKNWFNQAARHAALEFCATRPDELGPITPMLHAPCYAPIWPRAVLAQVNRARGARGPLTLRGADDEGR